MIKKSKQTHITSTVGRIIFLARLLCVRKYVNEHDTTPQCGPISESRRYLRSNEIALGLKETID